MGRHLQWWRMDFPPFIGAVARLTQTLGGGLQPWSVRLPSALAGATLILLAGWTARTLGGGAWAQIVAALAVLTAPLFVRASALFQPVVYDQLWWTLGYVALLILADDDRRRGWAFAAFVVGMGLLTKFSIGFFAVGVVVGVVVLPEWRSRLATVRPWVAVCGALLVGSASVVGQVRLGWPVRGQLGDLQSSQLARIGVGDFLKGQLLLGPAFLLAVVGLWALLVLPAFRRVRIVGLRLRDGGAAAGLAHAGRPASWPAPASRPEASCRRTEYRVPDRAGCRSGSFRWWYSRPSRTVRRRCSPWRTR